MTHLAEGILQELLDGELSPGPRGEADAHLAGCRQCSAELAELRGVNARASALLGMVDAQPPVLAARAAFARSRRGGGAWSGEARRALPRAAALLLLVAGAAAAAVPGSPVRRWVGLAEAPAERPVAPAPTQAADPAPTEPAAAGISILPDQGRVRVVITGAAAELEVHARLGQGPRAEVTARGAAVGARFRTAPGRIEVVGAGPGELLVELPADASAAVLEVNGRTVAAKQGELLRALAPTVGGTDTEPVFRAGN